MFAARLAQPVSESPGRSLLRTFAADLPAAALRRAWAHLWWSVRLHMADLHGLPRDEAVGPQPRRRPPTRV